MSAPAPSGERFPRRARLCRREEFRAAFARGVRVRSGRFQGVVVRNDLGHPRLGLAVGRKVGGAVQRNRVKRRLRELFRRHRERLPVPVDVVVIPLPGAAELDFATFEAQVLALWDRCRDAAS